MAAPVGPIKVNDPIDPFLDREAADVAQQLVRTKEQRLNDAADRIAVEPTITKSTRIEFAKRIGLKHVYTLPDIMRTSMYTAGALFLIYGLTTNPTLKKSLQNAPIIAGQMTQNLISGANQRLDALSNKIPSISVNPKITDKIKPVLEPVLKTLQSKINYTPDCLQKISDTKKLVTNTVTGGAQTLLTRVCQLTKQTIQTAQLTKTTVEENSISIGAGSVVAAIISQKTPEMITSRVNKLSEKTAHVVGTIVRSISEPAIQASALIIRKTAKASLDTAILGTKVSYKVGKFGLKTTVAAVKTTPKAVVSTIKLAGKVLYHTLSTTAKITYGTKKALGLNPNNNPAGVPINVEPQIQNPDDDEDLR